ncbi:hypothetical protein [Roseibium sediminis]|uniref:hypothetical protein n=1 Tax=Roseibium sediminis TaxID=1775174 RepID=UPI00123D3F45|nr:hypothetical protein [Roseibium sediminis]
MQAILASLSIGLPYVATLVAALAFAVVLLHELRPSTQDRHFGIWPEDEAGISRNDQLADRSAATSSLSHRAASLVATGLCVGAAFAEALFFFTGTV